MEARNPLLDLADLLREPSNCICEHVDIGVGWQKVAEDPMCPRCTPEGLAGLIVEAGWWPRQEKVERIPPCLRRGMKIHIHLPSDSVSDYSDTLIKRYADFGVTVVLVTCDRELDVPQIVAIFDDEPANAEGGKDG